MEVFRSEAKPLRWSFASASPRWCPSSRQSRAGSTHAPVSLRAGRLAGAQSGSRATQEAAGGDCALTLPASADRRAQGRGVGLGGAGRGLVRVRWVAARGVNGPLVSRSGDAWACTAARRLRAHPRPRRRVAARRAARRRRRRRGSLGAHCAVNSTPACCEECA